VLLNLLLVLTIVILGLDFVIGLWNSYISGYTFGLAKQHPTDRGSDFMLVYSVFGLVIGFAITIYVITIALGAGFAYFGYIDFSVLNGLLALNFLIFGGVITFFGIGLTIMSIYVTYKTRSKWSGLVSIWNVFATILNLYTYIKNFVPAVAIVKSQLNSKKDTGSLIILAAVGVFIGCAIAYVMYHAGRKKAEREPA